MARCRAAWALAGALLLPWPAPAQPYAICVDPGHGGTDPGAIGCGLEEAAVNLDTGLRLRDLLQANGFTVVMTRTTDTSVSLSSRSDLANSQGVDRFVSIHSNAADPPGTGIETYCAVGASSYSFDLRDRIQAEMIATWPLPDRGGKTANYSVLVNTNMPATLSELAFINMCSPDAEYLGSPTHRQEAAEAHLRAIMAHLGVQPTQEGTLRGVVFEDLGSGTADMSVRLPGATVRVLESGDSQTAAAGDAAWAFELRAGAYTVEASLAGFATGSRACEVLANQTTWCSIGLFREQPPDAGEPDAADEEPAPDEEPAAEEEPPAEEQAEDGGADGGEDEADGVADEEPGDVGGGCGCGAAGGPTAGLATLLVLAFGGVRMVRTRTRKLRKEKASSRVKQEKGPSRSSSPVGPSRLHLRENPSGKADPAAVGGRRAWIVAVGVLASLLGGVPARAGGDREVVLQPVPGFVRLGTEMRVVGGEYGRPSLSPDGRLLAFSRRAGQAGLFLRDLRSGRTRQLSAARGAGLAPAWGADGDRVGLRDPRAPFGAGALRWLDLDGRPTEAPREAGLRLEQRGDEVWLASPEGEIRLDGGEGGERCFAPVLSADGRHAVWGELHAGLRLLRIEDGARFALGPGNHPAFSPDGALLAFDRTADDGHQLTAGELWLVDLRGASPRLAPLTATPGRVETHPSLSRLEGDALRLACEAGEDVLVVDLSLE